MPTYDYACNACDHTFEAFQSMKDEPLRDCPACGQAALRRLIGTGAGLIFKGSGFYETDFKNGGRKPAEKSSNEPKSDKPAAKSDSASSKQPATTSTST